MQLLAEIDNVHNPMYIESTKRQLVRRLQEHCTDISKNRRNIALGRYCNDYKCQPVQEERIINSTQNKASNIRMQETIKIYMNRNHAINDKLLIPLHAAWKYVISDYKSKRKRPQTSESQNCNVKSDSKNQTCGVSVV